MHAHTTLILDGGTGSFQMFVQAAGLGELSAALSAGEVFLPGVNREVLP